MPGARSLPLWSLGASLFPLLFQSVALSLSRAFWCLESQTVTLASKQREVSSLDRSLRKIAASLSRAAILRCFEVRRCVLASLQLSVAPTCRTVQMAGAGTRGHTPAICRLLCGASG